MQDRYDAKSIEPRWQEHWAKNDLFRAGSRPGSPKKYVLAMLPYPSGEMHMGHARVYSITDVLARYMRKRGFDVLHPFGWDSFGLPAENAAIKEGVHPAVRTPKNVKSFKQDVVSLGISVDWSTEISTSDPAYYRWNQWFFLKMKERGLVYRRRAKVNFCPSCNTVLANEQVEEGKCWRCGSTVEEREIPEWAFRITAYADKLLEGLTRLDWPERVVAMQRNWIGRSDGLEIDFAVSGSAGKAFRVFTTRADTIFGATYVAAAPDHPLVQELAPASKRAELSAFAEKVRRAAKEVGAGAAAAEKEGIDTGIRVKNPFTHREVPVWVANFVLAGYGTGAVMAVPAHDQRDYEFAMKYGLELRWVVRPVVREGAREDSTDDDAAVAQKLAEKKQAHTEYGTVFDSGDFSGMPSQQARLAIAAEAQRRKIGQPAVNFHLRDWGVSRQRYWGTPIPIVYCQHCDPEGKGIAVPDDELPVLLPNIDVKEVLTGKGEPPLAKVSSWVNTTCPKCGGPARREAETMDTFVDSTWYWARYIDPKNDKEPFSRAKADHWLPIDVYVGGPEHAVLHLLYFRFWTMVMHELGLCAMTEPAQKLVTQGIVKGRDGEKMSKSKGNVVSPREIIRDFGADTARMFMLFAAPAEKDMDWSDEQVQGQHRFLGRVWRLVHASLPKLGLADGAANAAGSPPKAAALSAGAAASPSAADDLRRRTHKTILRVTQQLERLQFNTAISSLMELSNACADWQGATASLRESIEALVQLLSPFAPHVAEELWRELGHGEELVTHPWPQADPQLVVDDAYQIAVQVNGKLRGEVQVLASAGESEIRETAARDPKVAGWLSGKTVKKVVVIPKRLVNFVVA